MKIQNSKNKTFPKNKYEVIFLVFVSSLVISLVLTSMLLELPSFIRNFDKCSNSEIGCGILVYSYSIIFLYWTAIILFAFSIILLPTIWFYAKYRESKAK